MRLLFVTDRFGNLSIGSVLCWQTLITALRLRGHHCLVVTKTGQSIDNDHDIQTTSYHCLPDTLHSLIERYRPDAVLSQPLWSWDAAFALRHSFIPHIYFVRLQDDLNNNVLHEYPINMVITHSRFSKQGIDALFHVRSAVLPSFVQLGRPIPCRKRSYITIINPLRLKGGETFFGIAKGIPERQFLASCGWDTIAGNSLQPIRIPYYDGIDFSSVKNIRFVASTLSMREVYARTAILLLPSIVEETFSRIAYEALAYGIPTIIASDRGAFPEMLGRFGSLVSDYKNPSAWIDAIRAIKKTAVSAKEKRARANHLRQYDLDVAVSRMETLLVDCVSRNKTVVGKIRKLIGITKYQIKRTVYYN